MASLDPTLRAALAALLGLDDPDLSGELVVIAEVERYDAVAEDTDTLYVATQEWATEPGDTPSSEPYWARLRVPTMQQSILRSSEWAHTTSVTSSDLEIVTVDGAMDAEWSDQYEYRGRPVQVLAGLRSWQRSQFKPLPAGRLRVLDVLRGPETVVLRCGPARDRADAPCQPNLYAGFGAGYDFDATAHVAFGDTFNIGLRSFTIGCRFRSSGSANNEVMIDKRGSIGAGAGTAGYVLFKNTSDLIRLFLDNGSAIAALSVGSAGEYTDGAWHYLMVTGTRGGSMVAYVDGVADGTVSISAVTGRIASTVGLFHGKLGGSTLPWAGDLDEVSMWYRALPAVKVASLVHSALDGTEIGLVGLWRYDEYGGTDIFTEVLGPGLVVAHNPSTVSCSMGTTAGNPGSASATLCGVMRRAATGTIGQIAGRRTNLATASVGYGVRMNAAGQLIAEASDGTTEYAITAGGPYDDSTLWGWAMTIDRAANLIRLRVLDFPRGSMTTVSVSIAGAGSFGGAGVNFVLYMMADSSLRFTGSQSWVSFFPAALTEAEVRLALSMQVTDLDDGAPTTPPQLESLAALAGSHFWPLDENTGTTATDHIGAGWVSTLEGDIELRGTPKPVALGRVSRLLPVLVDRFFQIYQYSDPAYGATRSIDTVYAGALVLTGGGTDYTQDLTTSTITLVGGQDKPITMDVKGVISPKSSRWLRFPGEIIAYAWEEMIGIDSADIDGDSVTAYDEHHPYQAGYYFGSQPVAVAAFETYMTRPDGYAYRGLDGRRALGSRIDPTTAVADRDLSEYDSETGSGAIARADPVPVPPVTWLAKVGYDRTWYVHDSFLGGATAANQRKHQQEYRYVQDRRDELRAQYADAVVRTHPTPFFKRADASLLVGRMLDLDGVGRQGWALTMGADPWADDLGQVILVGAYSRYDLAGKQYLVIGYTYGLQNGQPVSVPVVWG